MKNILAFVLFVTLSLYSHVKCQRKHLSFADMKKENFDFDSLRPINSIYKDCGK